MRAIKKVIRSQKVDMGGILLDQPLPFADIDQIDPFLEHPLFQSCIDYK